MNLLWIDAILPVPNVLRSMETLSGVYAAASIHQAEELLHTHRIDLCLISNRMPQGDPLSLFPPGAEDGPVRRSLVTGTIWPFCSVPWSGTAVGI